MLLAGPSHPKTKELRLLLQCSQATVIGHLELLWHFTATHAIQGDIGKWSDGAIADACDWRGDPAVFVDALVAARWVDRRSAPLRLVTHDWHAHAPAWAKAKMLRDGLLFVTESPHTLSLGLTTTEPGSKTETQSGSEGPLLTTPLQASPSLQNNGQHSAARFPAWWKVYPKKVKKIPAMKLWKSKNLDAMADQLIADVQTRLEEDARWRDGFIPDPTTYLNQERWRDEISQPTGRRT